jgi:hypothetical protein
MVGIFADHHIDDHSITGQAFLNVSKIRTGASAHSTPCSGHPSQARFSRLVSTTKYSAGFTSSCPLVSQPITPVSLPHWPQIHCSGLQAMIFRRAVSAPAVPDGQDVSQQVTKANTVVISQYHAPSKRLVRGPSGQKFSESFITSTPLLSAKSYHELSPSRISLSLCLASEANTRLDEREHAFIRNDRLLSYLLAEGSDLKVGLA